MQPALFDANLSAATVCQWFELSAEAEAVRRQQPAVRYWHALIAGGYNVDALRFAAHLLPKRHAIWWGGLCVWRVFRPKPPKEVNACLEAVFNWAVTPEETQRRAAEAAAKAIGNNSAAGMVASASFMSDGSIAPPKCPEVKAEPRLSQKMIAAAVVLASAQAGPANVVPFRRDFLNTAQDICNLKLILPAIRRPQHA